MKLVFAAGVPFRSGELSEPSLSLVNCRLGEDYVPGLKATYCQGGFFRLELRVDLGIDDLVLLVHLLVSPDVRMPTLPAKPLCFLLLLPCIEVSRMNLLLCGERFRGVWKLEVGIYVFIFFVPDSFSDKRSI
jgi:hypothetical protein